MAWLPMCSPDCDEFGRSEECVKEARPPCGNTISYIRQAVHLCPGVLFQTSEAECCTGIKIEYRRTPWSCFSSLELLLPRCLEVFVDNIDPVPVTTFGHEHMNLLFMYSAIYFVRCYR